LSVRQWKISWGHRGRDRMVVGFTTTCAISVYYHWSCELKSCSWRGVLDTTLCDKVCQRLAIDWWFSLVSSTNKTDHHVITELFLKVALNTINLNLIMKNKFISKCLISAKLKSKIYLINTCISNIKKISLLTEQQC
jgi:hypothetical protein